MTIEQVQLAEHLMYNLLSIIRYDAYKVMLSLVKIINLCINDMLKATIKGDIKRDLKTCNEVLSIIFH